MDMDPTYFLFAGRLFHEAAREFLSSASPQRGVDGRAAAGGDGEPPPPSNADDGGDAPDRDSEGAPVSRERRVESSRGPDNEVNEEAAPTVRDPFAHDDDGGDDDCDDDW